MCVAPLLHTQVDMVDIGEIQGRCGEMQGRVWRRASAHRDATRPYISPYLPCFSPSSLPYLRSQGGYTALHLPVSPLYLHYLSTISPLTGRLHGPTSPRIAPVSPLSLYHISAHRVATRPSCTRCGQARALTLITLTRTLGALSLTPTLALKPNLTLTPNPTLTLTL